MLQQLLCQITCWTNCSFSFLPLVTSFTWLIVRNLIDRWKYYENFLRCIGVKKTFSAHCLFETLKTIDRSFSDVPLAIHISLKNCISKTFMVVCSSLFSHWLFEINLWLLINETKSFVPINVYVPLLSVQDNINFKQVFFWKYVQSFCYHQSLFGNF